MKKVSLSGSEWTIQDIWDWYQFHLRLSMEQKARVLDAVIAGQPAPDRIFEHMSLDEVEEFFAELGQVTMLSLLAVAEAALRVDFLLRVRDKPKDDITRQFRTLYKTAGPSARLEEDILRIWKSLRPPTKPLCGEFASVLNLRHWLAHGRYWIPKLGREYAPEDVYDIAFELLQQSRRARPKNAYRSRNIAVFNPSVRRA